jgi:hypothetical protein
MTITGEGVAERKIETRLNESTNALTKSRCSRASPLGTDYVADPEVGVIWLKLGNF